MSLRYCLSDFEVVIITIIIIIIIMTTIIILTLHDTSYVFWLQFLRLPTQSQISDYRCCTSKTEVTYLTVITDFVL